MGTAAILYLIYISEIIKTIAFIGTFCFLLAIGVCFFCMLIELDRLDKLKIEKDSGIEINPYNISRNDNKAKESQAEVDRYDYYMKMAKPLFMVFLLISALIPSGKTMYMMAATSWLDKSEIPEKVLKVLNNKLDEYLEEKK